jgi:glycosyltransferase involved in cell wall biosynthesis
MRVAIDAQLGLGTATGIGEYLLGLIPALRQHRVQIDSLRSEIFDPWRFDRRVLWDQLLLPASACKAELLHCAAGTMPALCTVPMVTTVHDVAWLRVQAHTRWYARSYFGDFMLKQYRRARRIIVVSDFSRRELLEFCDIAPDRIAVVHNGVDPIFSSIGRLSDPGSPFILAVGTVERRKNLEVVIRAMADMRHRSVRLVVVGPWTSYQDECQQLARELNVDDRIEFLGYVNRDDLLELYSTASLAVVPSHYEGFGYAAAQALVAGVPLIAANTSSLPEIVAGQGVLVEADSAASWAYAIDDILENQASAEIEARHGRAVAVARFHWSSAAAQTRDVYASALGAM